MYAEAPGFRLGPPASLQSVAPSLEAPAARVEEYSSQHHVGWGRFWSAPGRRRERAADTLTLCAVEGREAEGCVSEERAQQPQLARTSNPRGERWNHDKPRHGGAGWECGVGERALGAARRRGWWVWTAGRDSWGKVAGSTVEGGNRLRGPLCPAEGAAYLRGAEAVVNRYHHEAEARAGAGPSPNPKTLNPKPYMKRKT